MIPEHSMTLNRLAEWMQQLTSDCTISGDANADTAKLYYYSFKNCRFCEADINLEKGMVEWT